MPATRPIACASWDMATRQARRTARSSQRNAFQQDRLRPSRYNDRISAAQSRSWPGVVSNSGDHSGAPLGRVAGKHLNFAMRCSRANARAGAEPNCIDTAIAGRCQYQSFSLRLEMLKCLLDFCGVKWSRIYRPSERSRRRLETQPRMPTQRVLQNYLGIESQSVRLAAGVKARLQIVAA